MLFGWPDRLHHGKKTAPPAPDSSDAKKTEEMESASQTGDGEHPIAFASFGQIVENLNMDEFQAALQSRGLSFSGEGTASPEIKELPGQEQTESGAEKDGAQLAETGAPSAPGQEEDESAESSQDSGASDSEMALREENSAASLDSEGVAQAQAAPGVPLDFAPLESPAGLIVEQVGLEAVSSLSEWQLPECDGISAPVAVTAPKFPRMSEAARLGLARREAARLASANGGMARAVRGGGPEAAAPPLKEPQSLSLGDLSSESPEKSADPPQEAKALDVVLPPEGEVSQGAFEHSPAEEAGEGKETENPSFGGQDQEEPNPVAEDALGRVDERALPHAQPRAIPLAEEAQDLRFDAGSGRGVSWVRLAEEQRWQFAAFKRQAGIMLSWCFAFLAAIIGWVTLETILDQTRDRAGFILLIAGFCVLPVASAVVSLLHVWRRWPRSAVGLDGLAYESHANQQILDRMALALDRGIQRFLLGCGFVLIGGTFWAGFLLGVPYQDGLDYFHLAFCLCAMLLGAVWVFFIRLTEFGHQTAGRALSWIACVLLALGTAFSAASLALGPFIPAGAVAGLSKNPKISRVLKAQGGFAFVDVMASMRCYFYPVSLPSAGNAENDSETDAGGGKAVRVWPAHPDEKEAAKPESPAVDAPPPPPADAAVEDKGSAVSAVSVASGELAGMFRNAGTPNRKPEAVSAYHAKTTVLRNAGNAR